jgi:FkbM family methyltransferase
MKLKRINFLFNRIFFGIKSIISNIGFKKKPFRTIFLLIYLFILIIFKIRSTYKIKIKGKDYMYTFKPYLNFGMGGRGQFVFREYYDPFLNSGLKILPKSFNFIDVGCSRGFFSLFLLAHNDSEGRGVCIDPFDYALSDFKEVLLLNSLKNISILKGVVSNKINKKIYLNNIKIPSEASIVSNKFENNKDGFYCESFTIDQIINSMNLIKKVDFIKLDAEGAEFEILLGSIESLRKFKPIVYLENTRKEEEIKDLFLKHNYFLYYFNNDEILSLDNKKNPDSILALPRNLSSYV